MKWLFLSLCIMLTACTSEYNIKRDRVFVSIELVDSINNNPNTYGYSVCNNGVCTLYIRKDKYPLCITHEIRHAFEDNFHEGRESFEDCTTGEE